MDETSYKLEVGESLYYRENIFYIPHVRDQEIDGLLDGREGLKQSHDEFPPIEDINQQSEEPIVGNQQIVLPPSPTPSQPNTNEILSEDSSHHYLNDLKWKYKEDAKKWARERGKSIMCIIVCNGSTNDRHFQMVCECSGESKSHVKKAIVYEPKTKRKNTTFTKKTKCPFKLQFKYNKKSVKSEEWYWYLEKFVCGRHNHPIPETLLSHPYVARLNDEEKLIVSSMTENRMKPLDILGHIKLVNPNNVSTLPTIYNAKTKLKNQQWENRNQMQQLRHLGEKYNYSVFHNEDKDEQIRNLILAHPEFIQLAWCSNQVLLMDCTYKTNKYEMPVLNIVGQTSTNSPFSVAFCFLENELEESYVWALQQVKLFYVEGYTPKVIVTDKEQALLNAIARVFLDTVIGIFPSSERNDTVRILKAPYQPPPKDEEGRYLRNSYIIYENYLHFFPDFVREYIKATDEVHGDGNCGYHVFVDQLGPFEDAKSWDCSQVDYVRQKCYMELRGHRDYYIPMMKLGKGESDTELNERFVAWEKRLLGNKCLTSEYWMSMPINGQLLANAFNCVVHYISNSLSLTFAPTRIPFDEELDKTRRVVIGYVCGNHLIGLQMSEGCPLPPLFDCNEWSKSWCNRFEESFEFWKALQMSRSNVSFALMSDDEDD